MSSFNCKEWEIIQNLSLEWTDSFSLYQNTKYEMMTFQNGSFQIGIFILTPLLSECFKVWWVSLPMFTWIREQGK